MRGIVIDGIGCAGKTELIAALKVGLKTSGGFDVRELDHHECSDQFLRYLHEYATGENILFHRSHVSELVFGKLLRNRTSFSMEEVAILDSIVSLRFVYVLAEPPSFESFLERMVQRRSRRAFTRDEYLAVIERFREASSKIPHERYVSTTRDELASVQRRVLLTLGITTPPVSIVPISPSAPNVPQ